MESGLYSNIANEAYHKGEGISKSGLALIMRSPAHYAAREEYKETPALILGSAIDMAVFEPASFMDTYAVKPEGMKFTTKEGKAWKEERGDLIILKQEEFKACEEIAKNVRSHPVAGPLLDDGEAQVSGYWTDPNFNVLCKLRMDWLNKKQKVVVDLKSCEDARPHAFTRDAYKYHYDMQAFLYLYGLSRITGIEHREFFFVCAEKKPPFAIQVYKATEEFLTHGGVRCSRAMTIYTKCLEKDEWPAYPEEVQDLELPGWVKRQEGMQEIWE